MTTNDSGVHLYGAETQVQEKPFAVATELPGEKPKPELLPSSLIIRVCLTVLGVLLGVYLVYRVLPVLLLLLIAIMLATAIEPVVNKLRRGPFSRSQGVLIVYVGIFAVLIGIAWLIVPIFINQVGEVIQRIPATVKGFHDWAASIHDPFLRGRAVDAADALNALIPSNAAPPTGSATERVASVSQTALSVAESALSVILLFVIAFYWMTERTLVKRWVVSALPADRGNRVRRVWDDIEVKVGGWVRGQLTLMAIVGLISAAGYFLIGVSYWPALALFIAIAEAIPLVGPYIGTAPAILVALTQQGNDGVPALLGMQDVGGVTRALMVAVFAILLQTVEGNVLVPRIMRNSVGISALTVIVSLLLGSALAGLVGALLAVPIAGAIQVIVMDLQAAATLRAEKEKRRLSDEAEKEARANQDLLTGDTAPNPDPPRVILPGAAADANPTTVIKPPTPPAARATS